MQRRPVWQGEGARIVKLVFGDLEFFLPSSNAPAVVVSDSVPDGLLQNPAENCEAVFNRGSAAPVSYPSVNSSQPRRG